MDVLSRLNGTDASGQKSRGEDEEFQFCVYDHLGAAV
jgi:hypothetical protein